MEVLVFFLLTSVVLVTGQRPFYAGSRPIGVYVPFNITTTTESIGDRVGEDGVVTTQRLPLEANGDKDLIDRLSKLPIDNQPFWFINWQALEKHRENQQTYPQRPNTFISPITPTPTANSNIAVPNINSNSEFPNLNSGTAGSVTPTPVSTVADYIITSNLSGTSNDNKSVTTSSNSIVKTTTEIQSTTSENKDSEYITEDPTNYSSSIVLSSSSLPTTYTEISKPESSSQITSTVQKNSNNIIAIDDTKAETTTTEKIQLLAASYR